MDPRSIAAPPEESIVIDFAKGSYEGVRLCQKITLPSNTAHVGVFIEGKGYCGNCYVEQPFLSAIGQNLLPAFDESTPQKPQFEWAAQYLSRKEWPVFRVRLNGRVIHTGEIFERVHRHSEWEIELPAHLLKEQNILFYELISDYHDPLPYTVYEIGLIEQKAGTFSILATDHAAPAGGKARVLIRTEKPNLTLTFKSLDGKLSAKELWVFKQAGLHGMLLDCGEPSADARFELVAEGQRVEGVIDRIVCRGEDKVVTGTGDMVYINQNEVDMEEYLSWYLSNRVGDFITIRPTYRWSGTRVLNPGVWRSFCRLMRELDLKYVLMRDGREVEGLSTQPDFAMLKGKNFYGIQMHELDNIHYYGGPYIVYGDIYSEQVSDLFAFAYQEDPTHTRSNLKPNDRYDYIDGKKIGRYYRSYDWSWNRARKESVASIAARRREEDTRHTGASAMFKYFAEAGFSWIGAETMYNTMEPYMGFLRGVAKDYKMPTCGAHHAVQWSTTPHDSPARFRRYRLALYASYLLGATDINTEEGLWRLEEYYQHHHRFGKACLGHLQQQQDFYRYVTTHTRSGSFYHPVALIHGRDDGTTFFGKDRTWGRRGDPQTAAEDSWDLLTCIYPMAKPVDRLYIHNCPEDRPVGFHTGTPYGNMDAVPAESKLSTFMDYRSLIFLAYNRMEAEDAERLLRYVRRGGRVLMTRAHLTQTDDIASIRSASLSFAPHALALCEGDPVFRDTSVDGNPVSVCVNAKKCSEVLAYSDDGLPLICRYAYGKGEIILFNTKAYPSDKAIRSLYEEKIRQIITEEVTQETAWAQGADNVEFAAYRQADGACHFYFLATDWYADPAAMRHASLTLCGQPYELLLPFGVMVKAVAKGDTAAWPHSEEGEVLSVADGKAVLQGIGKVPFTIVQNGTQKTVTVDFSTAAKQTISI